MLNNKKLLLAGVLMSALSAQAEARTITADGLWHQFDVDNLTAISGGLGWIDLDGNRLTFDFTLTDSAVLDVVDAGFSGDRFVVYPNSRRGIFFPLGETSLATNSYPNSIGLDFDAAFADSDYSKFSISFLPGTYSITGYLSQSAVNNGTPINATVGAIRLSPSPAAVPLPAAAWLYLTGTALMGFVSLRRQSK